MFTVALIGPDGAGKSTIGQRLRHSLPVPVCYIYMGFNDESTNIALPTTRLIRAIKRACGSPSGPAGPPDPKRIRPRPRGVVRRTLSGIKSALWLSNRMGEECFRQAVAWYYQRRGHIALFDRHFFVDHFAYDPTAAGQEQPFSRRLHGLFLARLYPKPDLVIYLDAPAEVLFARKREGTLETLECRRQGYLQMRHLFPHFIIVDASQPEDAVTRDVTEHIWAFYQSRARKGRRIRNLPA